LKIIILICILQKPFAYKTGWFALYEIPTPGTWEIRVLLSLPLDDITYTHSYGTVRTNGECRKYFYVKDKGQYDCEQLQKERERVRTERETIRETRDGITQKRMEELNIAILIISFITIVKPLWEFSKNNKDIIMGLSGLIISVYFLQFTTLILSTLILLLYTVGFGILFFTSLILLIKKQVIKKHKSFYFIILSIIVIMSIFLLIYFTQIFEANYFYATIGFLISLVPILAVIAELSAPKNREEAIIYLK